MSTERVVPHNLDAERAVLGVILVHGVDPLEELLLAFPGFEPRHFFRKAHQQVFAAMLALHQRRREVDFITLKTELAHRGELEEVGGPADLSALASGIPRSTNLPYYGRLVREAAQRRQLIQLGATIQADAYDENKPTAAVLDRAEQDLFDASTGSDGERPVLSVSELLPEVMGMLEKIQDDGSPVTGCPTGFDDLDAMTRGMQRGNLDLLAARPKMGKTALAKNIAYNAARQGRHVVFFSLEMSRSDLMFRLIASIAKVDLHQLLQGTLPPTAYSKIANAQAELDRIGHRLRIDDTRTLGPLGLRSKARRSKRLTGALDLIVVDYLQLMQAPDRGYRNRTVEVAQISRLLRATAQELDAPVLALCQLNRNTDERSGNRPRISDLRESGALEQDADLVMMLHRDEYYETTDENQGQTELIIGAQRNGPTGTVRLYFHAEQVRFASMTIRPEAVVR